MENGENSFKACNQCKRPVPAHDIRKTCEKCRAKSRERSRVKKLALAAQLKNLPPPAPAQNQSMLKKRQAEDIPNTSNKAPKKLSTVTPEEPPTLYYQKASCLYDAIKETTSSTPSCTFAGCHSIIRCDNIDHARREQIVASDLRKIVKIPFRHGKPLNSIKNDTNVRVKYSCTCGLFPPKTLTSTKLSNLAQHNDNVAPCGGIVIITVRDDDSHPLPIPGQQIIVQIVH